MPGFLRRLMNNETYVLILGIFLGAGTASVALGLSTLLVYADVMMVEADALVLGGLVVFIIGLIGLVHWNMTE